MPDVDSSVSPLEAAAGAAGPHATEAFALLANETRLAILLALWETFDPGAEDNTVSFSELYERVDYDNPGNFSYHLEKLSGQFIRKGAEGDGYELRTSGLQLIQTVIAGAGMHDTTLEPTAIDRACWFCDAPTAVTYQDGVVYQVCTECEGITTDSGTPDGTVSAIDLHPAGVTERTPEGVYTAGEVAAYRHIRTMYEGLCSVCSGPVDAWLECCTEHDPAGICETCGRKFATWARFQCRICKDFHVASPKALVLFHPRVIAFYDDHGVAVRWHAADFESITHVGDLIRDHEMALVSEDPPRVEVTISLDGDELRVTFDETASVVDVCR